MRPNGHGMGEPERKVATPSNLARKTQWSVASKTQWSLLRPIPARNGIGLGLFLTKCIHKHLQHPVSYM